METDSRYPIGKFARTERLTASERAAAIAVLEAVPENLRAAVAGLEDLHLETPYREGGWTLRQVVHHLADSNGLCSDRMRWALTEDWPTIMPADEDAWARLEDARTMPVEVSLELLDPLHQRWVALLRSIPEAQWTERGFAHPKMGRTSLEQALALYAWHNRHHMAHITSLRQRKGW
jgi:uncharacterized damage-inducible protein DinB